MTDDPHRDPTRTEDVEEKNEILSAIYAVQDALKVGLYDAEWRRQRADDEGSAEIHKKQIEEGQDAISMIRDTIRDLRSRLSEAKEERDQYRDLWRAETDDRVALEKHVHRDDDADAVLKARAARRRADRLEEAVREAHEALNNTDANANDYAEALTHIRRQVREAREALSAALDSREDEEEDWWRECHDCGEVMRVYESDPPTCGACDSENVTDDPYRGCGPVHADEPEGDWERRARTLLGKLLEDIQGGRTDSVVDCPCSRVARQQDEIAELLSEPTDDPVSRRKEYQIAIVRFGANTLFHATVNRRGVTRTRKSGNPVDALGRAWKAAGRAHEEDADDATQADAPRELWKDSFAIARALFNADLLDVPMRHPGPSCWEDVSEFDKGRITREVCDGLSDRHEDEGEG